MEKRNEQFSHENRQDAGATIYRACGILDIMPESEGRAERVLAYVKQHMHERHSTFPRSKEEDLEDLFAGLSKVKWPAVLEDRT